MRFLIYTNHLGRSSVNGTSISIMVKELADYLVRRGEQVLVVGNKNIVEVDLSTDYVSLEKRGRLRGDLGYPYNLAKVIREFNPDIVYSFMRPMSVNLAVSTFFYRNPSTLYAGSIHNANNYLSHGKTIHLPYRYLLKFLLERLDILSGPSQAILEDIKKTFFVKEEKLVYLPNFINFKKIESLSRQVEPEWDNYLLNIGKLESQKNHQSLIRVFSRLISHFPDLKLVIVGDGSLKKKLEKMIEDLSLQQKVKLLGYRENPWTYYTKAKLFVLTSIFEGFPLVGIEAMYFKVPIVSFDIKPMVELTLGGRCGIMVRSFDEEEMYRKLKSVLKGEIDLESLKEEGHKRSLEFHIDNFVDSLIERYSIIKKG